MPPTSVKTVRDGGTVLKRRPRSFNDSVDLDQEFGVSQKDESEQRLEQLLFGDEEGFLDSLKQRSRLKVVVAKDNEVTDADNGTVADLADEDLFFLDFGDGGLPAGYTREANDHSHEPDQHPVWLDSDDDRLRVSLATNPRLRKLRDTEADDVVSGTEYIRRLRRQYERLHPAPAWAKDLGAKRQKHSHDATDSDSDDSDTAAVQPLTELLGMGSSLVNSSTPGRGRHLRPEVLDVSRLKDVAKTGAASVDVLQFHPHLPLLLSAGPSSIVSLYHVSPQSSNPNPLLTSLHLRGAPAHSAEFRSGSSKETEIFIGSRRRYFHVWSLATGVIKKATRPVVGTARKQQKTMESFKLSPDGRHMGLIGSTRSGGGCINVLSTDSMQWECQCRLESHGGVADFAWWKDGRGFAAVGKNGEVSEFDLQIRRVLGRWQDEGAVGTTVIAVGGFGAFGGRWVAIGSSSGIVNLYDRTGWAATAPVRPKPTRSFQQLTTPISNLVFAEDGEMLVVASRWKKNALRLVHLPSCTVYRNWPTDSTPLGRISAVALSRRGDLLAVGNEQGKVRLWEIRD